MTDPKANQPTPPKAVARPKNSPANVARDPAPSPDLIRERAYELYETRGRVHGQDEHDWLLAEEEITRRKR